MPDPQLVTVPTVKPGYRSTEFWLSLLAVAIVAVLSSGILPPMSTASRIAGIVGAILLSLGYTGARTVAKMLPPAALLVILLGSLLVGGVARAEAATQTISVPLIVAPMPTATPPLVTVPPAALSADPCYACAQRVSNVVAPGKPWPAWATVLLTLGGATVTTLETLHSAGVIGK